MTTLTNSEGLEILSKILIRCFLMGAVLLLFWAGAIFFAGDLAYVVHNAFIQISREQFNVINYVGMMGLKATIFILFLLPWVAIRIVMNSRRS